MTTATYDKGDNRRLSIVFTDFNDLAASPTTVTAIITEPDGVQVNPVVVNDGVGLYHADFTFTKAGRHKVRFEGVGALVSAEQTDVYIRA